MTIRSLAVIGPLPPPAGGMANLTLKLVELISKENINVNLVQTNAPYYPQWIAKVKGVRAVIRLIPYFYKLYTNTKNIELVHIMANSGWSWYLFVLPAILISRINGCAIVVNYHGGAAEMFFAKSWWWVKQGLLCSNAVVVPSSFLSDIFALYDQPSHIVPNPIDIELFKPKALESRNDNLHIIVTRNLEKIYGVSTILNAFRLILNHSPNAKLTVAGSGPELINLQKQAKSLNIESSVLFAGRLKPPEMVKLYQSADVMLNASLVDNTPGAIIEALACGVPVITSNVGGIPNLVRHEYDALIVATNTAQSYADAVVMLLSDHQLRNKIVAQGLKNIERFSWKNIWPQLLAVYQQAIDKQGH